ncbi:HAD-like domain-containing protein [Penicillium atrosanguineum]|uniref:HAD-like domain-containing protein n=1 Tax=Penicillium atrosanguineum TaxID=1132637 RepID=A0A9W9PZN2_9EURO|nr:HAD-like domain-containing protein [Penicillium atrosanguineum]KAJ5122629.1 HAD-like domain-containing protein [Penicillium atrosanguineum]KAJ5140357.1 HAD-like domain-containing protein [Penicillium atrosanguineum]KAJ5310271.1 HAD-like domain-containing protein [Penicillium atrosanguineum]KAJ5315788.1 HAD-like domain-containing protein [Penicillium atrosanguineum]
MADKTVVAFDLYGTLLSTDSIVKKLEKLVGSKAESISTLWRRYQLEYTWRLNSMGRWETFYHVTQNSLLHALAEHGEQLSAEDQESVMKAYDSLATFVDVQPALNRVAATKTIYPVIFSNGDSKAIRSSVKDSAGLATHSSIFHDLISVEDIKRYKPSVESYKHLAEKVGKQSSQMNEMWLISGNPFDIVGARNAGMNAIWVDRANKGWQDAAVPTLQPTAIVHSLEQIVEEIHRA